MTLRKFRIKNSAKHLWYELRSCHPRIAELAEVPLQRDRPTSILRAVQVHLHLLNFLFFVYLWIRIRFALLHITLQCCCSAVQSQSLRNYYVLTQLFFLSTACFFGLMIWTCSAAFSAKQLTAFELAFPLARTYPTLLTNDFLLYTVRMLGFFSFARGTSKTSLWSAAAKLLLNSPHQK